MKRAYDALPAIYDVSFSDEKWISTLDAVSAAASANGAMLFGVNEAELVYQLDLASSFYADKLNLLPKFMEEFGHYDHYGREFLLRVEPHKPISDLDIWPSEDLWNREDIIFMRENVDSFLRVGVNLSPNFCLRVPQALDTIQPVLRSCFGLGLLPNYYRNYHHHFRKSYDINATCHRGGNSGSCRR